MQPIYRDDRSYGLVIETGLGAIAILDLHSVEINEVSYE